jgi:hypothetical protein
MSTPVKFQSGQIFSYFWSGDHYFPGLTDKAIAQAAASGATGITLAWNEYVNPSTGTIYDFNTLSDITKVAGIAKSYGLTVSLQPYFQVSTLAGQYYSLQTESFETYFGLYSKITPNSNVINTFLRAFQPNYQTYLQSLGKIANSINASYLAIGGEMSPLDASAFDSFWQNAINTVRGVFTGPLTYVMWGSIIYDQANQASNSYDGAPYHYIDMYKWLDLVAPQIHKPLSNTTTLTYAQAMAGLNANTVASSQPMNTLRAWKAYADSFGLPMITAESGFTSYTTPWIPADKSLPTALSPTYDIQQAELTQAFFDAVKLNPNDLAGITFIANVFPDDTPGDGVGPAQFSQSWWWKYGWSTWDKPAMYTYEASVSGTDTMHGVPGADSFVALVGRPTTIHTNQSNDTIFSESTYGSTFDGQSAAVDTAIYNSPSTNYVIRSDSSGIHVLDEQTQGAKADLLLNIVNIQFTDMTVQTKWLAESAALPVASMAALTDVYIAYFNRAPDAGGLYYWASRMSEGMTVPQTAASFAVQQETVAQYPATMSTGDFIVAVYQNVLNRNALATGDAAGYNYWLGQLQSGAISKSAFVLAIINGALANSGSTADTAYLSNKEAAGAHFAITDGLTDTAQAHAVMSLFNSTYTTSGPTAAVTAANHLADADLANISAHPELVFQLSLPAALEGNFVFANPLSDAPSPSFISTPISNPPDNGTNVINDAPQAGRTPTISDFQYGPDRLNTDLIGAANSMPRVYDNTATGIQAISIQYHTDPSQGIVPTA